VKTIVAGSRTIKDKSLVAYVIKRSGFKITEVVSGRAKGVDTLGEEVAHDLGVSVKPFPANWNKHGKAAGYIRNQEMADYAEALIAIWDGKSRGTRDMISRAKKKGLKVFVHNLQDDWFDWSGR